MQMPNFWLTIFSVKVIHMHNRKVLIGVNDPIVQLFETSSYNDLECRIQH